MQHATLHIMLIHATLPAAALVKLLTRATLRQVLVCMIECRMGYYCPSMCGLSVDQRVMESLFQHELPVLHKHLQDSACAVGAFAVSWFLCLFVESPIPIEFVPLFWDRLFLYGDELIFSLTLALLRQKRSQILEMEDGGELLVFLLHGGVRRDVQWSSLLHALPVGHLVDRISHLRHFHQADVVRKASVLNIGTATKLSREHGFDSSGKEVQSLWYSPTTPTTITTSAHCNSNTRYISNYN